MGASTAALATVELLEKILNHLPMLDILQIQRVSHLWQECVQGSALLQRKSFRMAIPIGDAPRVRKHSRYSTQPVAVNPLLRNIFRIRHSEISGSRITIVPPRTKRRLQQGSISENVLKKVTNSHELEGIAERPLVMDSEYFYNRPARRFAYRSLYDPFAQQSYTAPSGNVPPSSSPSYTLGNWATMLATQPPVQTLNLRCDSMGGYLGGMKVIAADGVGVTLGDVAKRAAEFYRTCEQQTRKDCSFDPEMTIYQPVDAERPKNTKSALKDYTESQLRKVDKDQLPSFQRAWKTKLRCNLG